MLALKVFDRGTTVVLTFEHSLLSLSKWEARTKKPYLTRGPKSTDEMIDYYRDMLTSPEHDPDLVYRLSPEDLDRLDKYINDPQTAGSFPPESEGSKHGEVVTSDTLYMQMTVLHIDFRAEAWHLNRLMMLIAKVAHAKTPQKKEDKRAALSRWSDINAKNRAFFKSKG